MMSSASSPGSGGLTPIVEGLCAASRRHYQNPYDHVGRWPATVEADHWFTSPELVSLYGTPAWDSLSEGQRKRLSFYEAVNFYSLNIHGERSLVEGLARRVYGPSGDALTPYLSHVLDEENKHMVYFGEFCTRYAGLIYPDQHVAFTRDYVPGEEDVVFFARVLIFEEIVDAYNVRMAVDRRLHPVARQINALHHRDEARHLVFGRRLIRELLTRWVSAWPAGVRERVAEELSAYVRAAWREYYNPRMYRDAGIPGDPYDLGAAVFQHPRCREHRRRVSRCLRHLSELGIRAEEATP